MSKDQPAGITRREFLGRMGVAGAALGIAKSRGHRVGFLAIRP